MTRENVYEIRFLQDTDTTIISSAFEKIGWDKPESLCKRYLQEQEANQRYALVAWQKDIFLGYVTLKLMSDYLPFKTASIPEVSDLNVLPQFRNQGIGSKLLDAAEEQAFHNNSIVGIAVGLTADYGEAQKLYVRQGYVPDGRGITYQKTAVQYLGLTYADDDLVLWLIKHRKAVS